MRNLLALLLFLNLACANAQDPIFTQYFIVPETLNAGFTGYLETTNMGVLHRSQWPNLNLRIDTDFAYANFWVEKMQSGLGVTFLNHRENFTNYTFSEINLAYAYRVTLSNDWYFRPAIEVGMGNKSYGFNSLILQDQLNLGSGTVDPVTVDPLGHDPRDHFFFADFSAALLVNNESTWFGLSLKHLNQPNISLTDRGNLPLDMFFAANAGHKFKLANYLDVSVLPYETQMLLNANLMKQGNYNRLDVGAELLFKDFFFGVSAATSPFTKAEKGEFLTSINAFAGLQYQHLKFALSHDFNTTGIGRTGGIYELSCSYQFDLYINCLGCPQRGTDRDW